MIHVTGMVVRGIGEFGKRIASHREAFRSATGEDLFPGTINVRIPGKIPIRETFRLRGCDIGEPFQDFLFEICRINGVWAYRVRPYHAFNNAGGYGDGIFEIACAQELPNCGLGAEVEIGLFREPT